MEECTRSIVAAKRVEATPDICPAPTLDKRRAGRGRGNVRQAAAERGGTCSRCNRAMTGTPACCDDSYASGRGAVAALRTPGRSRRPGYSEVSDS